MKSWQDQIPGAFGVVDKKFAGHPFDVQRALKLLVAAIEAGASYADNTTVIRQWLVAQGRSGAFVNAQMRRVRNVGFYFP